MTIGFWHGELASLLWGSLFGCLVFYTLAVSLALRWRAPTFSLRQALPHSTAPEPTQLVIRVNSLPLRPPLFRWHLVVDAHHSLYRSAQTHLTIDRADNVVMWRLPRGRYAATARWELRDALGLSLWRPRNCVNATLLVGPGKDHRKTPVPTARSSSDAGSNPAIRREGETFDVRSYQPGDDFRRIHWPLWAHSGETWVRIPDLSPPPTGQQVWLLDLSVPEATTDELKEAVLDVRVACLKHWLGPESSWALLVPALGVRCTVAAELDAFLAGLSVSAPLPRFLPEDHWSHALPSEVLVVSGAGSPGLQAMANALTFRCRVRPVLVELPSPPPLTPSFWWNRK